MTTKFMRQCLRIGILCGGMGCGSSNENKTPVAEAPMNADATSSSCDSTLKEESIRLQGVGLLARTFIDVLGVKADVNVRNADERLFETYRGNFGGNEGLGYGDIYADNLTKTQSMTAYFLALNIVAYNAALQCESKGDEEFCDCQTEESASAMLGRAIPDLATCEDSAQLVTEFSELCQENYVYAVTSLMSSVAVAKRH